MTLSNVFLFAGQGSQYHRMGSWLREHDEVFRRTLLDLDAVVRAERGDSVVERMHGAPVDEPMDRFADSQPAIFMTEYALATALVAQGVEPDAVVGASLGETAAAAVAGVVDPEECLLLLLRQVEIFERHCPPGGMLAVLADPGLFDRAPALHRRCELAAVNSAGNFVVAGTAGELDRAEEYLAGEGVLFQRLPVPFAFHSSAIDAVAEEFTSLIGTLTFHPPRIPVLSCTTGGEVARFDAEHLWRAMRHRFDVRPVLDRLLREDRHRYLDLGPSGSMANLITPLLPTGSASVALPLLSPFSQDGSLFEKVLEHQRRDGPTAAASRPKAAHMTENTLRVHLFPGQGSQIKGMGEELFRQFPELTAKADAILGYSVRELCVDDPERLLRRTEYTQPALYVVSALSHLASLQEGERLPDYVLGHSLGEYAALFAAGVFDFETGLRLVSKRGELMGRAGGGTMAAVSGRDAEAVGKLLRQHRLDAIDIANINAPSQTVIAGPQEEVERAVPLFTEDGARCAALNVSAPFHSRYMAGAAEEFGRFLDGFAFSAPKIPVIANVDARPYGGAAEVGEKLRRQIDHPVRWADSIRYLMARGTPEARELGPGSVLTKLVAKIESEATPLLETAAPPAPAPTAHAPVTAIREAHELGAAAFREAHGVEYAYAASGLHQQVGSVEFVVALARAGFLSFLGSSGLTGQQLGSAIRQVRQQLGGTAPFGVNLTYSPFGRRAEREVVDAALREGVRALETSAYVQITPELVRYRLRGAGVRGGSVHAPQRLLAKVTHPETAMLFLRPAPPRIVERLLAEGVLSAEEARAAESLPMADDVCAMGDSGGYTELGLLPALLPSVRRLRERAAAENPASGTVRVGAGGGIGTPEAAAAAFVLGADFVLTGSVNACTVESGFGGRVKDMLQNLDVRDTTYAPFGDLFELGGRARVMKKGVLFHARANKLYDLWRTHDDWESIAPRVRSDIEQRYFQASFETVHAQARARAAEQGEEEPEPDPKRRMALVFRWYCDRALQLAAEGEPGREADFQVFCGPAMGACNEWLRGTDLEEWKQRHAAEIGRRIMEGAARITG